MYGTYIVACKPRFRFLNINIIFLFSSDSNQALALLERLQKKLSTESSDGSHDEDLATLIYMLDSPLFTQLLNIQDALQQLKQARHTLLANSVVDRQ